MITCYSPVRHATHPRVFTFDLHASSTPPTFVLSQDQTLHFMYVQSTLFCNNGSSQGSTWLFVAKPQSPTNLPKNIVLKFADTNYGRLPTHSANHAGPKSHVALLRIGLIKKLTRFFFRGHPECQRSSPKSELGSLLGAGNVSELVGPKQATGRGFFG